MNKQTLLDYLQICQQKLYKQMGLAQYIQMLKGKNLQ